MNHLRGLIYLLLAEVSVFHKQLQETLPSLSLSQKKKSQVTGTHLYPLLSVDLHTIGTQRSDGSVNDLVHHLRVAVGLFQLGSSDPNVTIGGDVLSSLVQDTTGILVRF